jgi:hypothetical protein
MLGEVTTKRSGESGRPRGNMGEGSGFAGSGSHQGPVRAHRIAIGEALQLRRDY